MATAQLYTHITRSTKYVKSSPPIRNPYNKTVKLYNYIKANKIINREDICKFGYFRVEYSLRVFTKMYGTTFTMIDYDTWEHDGVINHTVKKKVIRKKATKPRYKYAK